MMLSLIVLFAVFAIAQSFMIGNVQKRSVASTSKLNLFGNPEPPKADKKDQAGLFGGMGNMMDNIKKAQEIAKQAQEMNKELMETYFTGSDPTGQVTATFNGLGAPVSMKVSDSILGQGSEAVSVASSQAMVDAHMKATQAMMIRMQNLYTGGAGVPK